LSGLDKRLKSITILVDVDRLTRIAVSGRLSFFPSARGFKDRRVEINWSVDR